MNIQKYFSTTSVKLGKFKFDLDVIEEEKKINKLLTFFKTVNLFFRSEYKQPPKYYLQNKVKKDTDGIQYAIRNEVDKLNNIYDEKFYFIKINKTILNKKENKHTYNIFHTTIIEYIKINIFDDFVSGIKGQYYSQENPLGLVNLSNQDKLQLYNEIEDSINSSQIYSDYDKENDFNYNNRYCEKLKKLIASFIVSNYTSKNKSICQMYEEMKNIDKHVESTSIINIHEFLEANDSTNNEKYIKNIMNIMIEGNIEYFSNMINMNYLKSLL